MRYRMNFEIGNLSSILEHREAWIPSEDSSDRSLYGYTLWLGSSIRAYVAGLSSSWTAWVFTSGTDFKSKGDECYQYSCKRVAARQEFGSRADAMNWAETMTRMGE